MTGQGHRQPPERIPGTGRDEGALACAPVPAARFLIHAFMNTTTTSGPLASATGATSANSANLGGALARRHEWLPLPTLLGYALAVLAPLVVTVLQGIVGA